MQDHRSPPVVTAVALSTAYLKLGELARRAFTGRESFVLEKGRLPVAAVVSAREWLDYLATRHAGRRVGVRRTGLSQPRSRRPAAKPTPETMPATRRKPGKGKPGKGKPGKRKLGKPKLGKRPSTNRSGGRRRPAVRRAPPKRR
jgi:hypothetical protein